MKACGIIVEYNPFHHGHEYHIERARALTGCDVLVAVMSGNFVQRGEPAILDKWKRAETAVRHGVDLIIDSKRLAFCPRRGDVVKTGAGFSAGLWIGKQ